MDEIQIVDDERLDIARKAKEELEEQIGSYSASGKAIHPNLWGAYEVTSRAIHSYENRTKRGYRSRIDHIQRVVADEYGIELEEMRSRRKPKGIAFPRQIAMYLSRRLTKASFPEIGEEFNRTHATAIYACKVVEGEMESDRRFRLEVDGLLCRLDSRSETSKST